MSTIKSTYIQKVGVGTDAFELPANDGTSGQYLQTNGSGTLSWQTVASLSNAEDGTGTNFEFNSGFGSNGVAYGVRAWCNFNGKNTIAIRDSGNISSLTDEGVGEYQLAFTNAMPDGNYAVVGSTGEDSSGGIPNHDGFRLQREAFLTTDFGVASANGTTLADHEFICCVVVR